MHLSLNILMRLAEAAEPIQHSGVFQKTSTIPWWGYIIVTLLPWVLGMALAISATTYWKRINRAEGNNPIPVAKMFIGSILAGFFFGALLQWGLQELVAHLTGAPIIGAKGVVISAVFTGMFTPMGYELIRIYARRKGWEGLYAVLTVRHEIDERADSELGDLTKMHRNEDTIPTPKKTKKKKKK